jgi:transcriptional regulator with XRE-family HTH domain
VPAGRPPNPLTPDASLAHAVGAEIRSLREAGGLTLEALGLRIGYTAQHISAAEQAKTTLSFDFLAAIDAALGSRLVARHDALAGERARNRSTSSGTALRCPQEIDDVKRRAFLGLGLAVVLLGPEAAARASADDWDRIAHAWSYEIDTANDAQSLLPGLTADLERNPPPRTAALLHSYVASIAISGGDPVQARRSWAQARRAAAQAADPQLAAYVAGKQAVQGLYGAYAPAQVIILADDALAATGQPCTGRIAALCAKGQALAMLKRVQQTRDCYGDIEREFERLPRDVTREKLSVLGFAEERMHNSRSFAGMFIGGGEPAREEALRLYAAANWRGAAQVRLHRAAADHDPAYAGEVLSGLSEAQRSDRRVRLIARRVAIQQP